MFGYSSGKPFFSPCPLESQEEHCAGHDLSGYFYDYRLVTLISSCLLGVFLSMDFWQSEEQKQNLSADLHEKESTEF